jgi:hypothetical protein
MTICSLKNQYPHNSDTNVGAGSPWLRGQPKTNFWKFSNICFVGHFANKTAYQNAILYL